MDTYIAAPLTKGSATGEGVNQPGRRQEDDVNLVAFHTTESFASGRNDDLAPTMRVGAGVGAPSAIGIAQGASVRRLTPTECERLQALPDGWTNPDGDAPDSRRYAGLGDAVTASVGEWIGRRILTADQELA